MQLTHPPYKKPELLATAPVFSRYVTGWMVAYPGAAIGVQRELARWNALFVGTFLDQPLGQLRAFAMSSKPVAFLLAIWG
jgi:hypothetical protein